MDLRGIKEIQGKMMWEKKNIARSGMEGLTRPF